MFTVKGLVVGELGFDFAELTRLNLDQGSGFRNCIGFPWLL